MKIGSITTANSKGQIVIPKTMRDALKINQGDKLGLKMAAGGVFIYPISGFVAEVESENSYLSLLEKTKGTWADEDWKALRERRAKTELRSSRARKNAW